MKYTVILLITLTATFCFSQTKPAKIYVAKSAYFASYYLKDKGSFAPFKEIKGAKDKYRFEFYDKVILLKTPSGSSTLVFERAKMKYEGVVSVWVHDKTGKQFVLEISSGQVDGMAYNNIDVFELDKKNGFKTLTKYICRVL